MRAAKDEGEGEAAFLARDIPKGMELGIRNYWYPVLASEDLPADKPVAFKALGEELVAWRNRNGEPCVMVDKCPHRGAKFSLGRVLGGDLQCAWHGLRFDGSGRCTMIPWEPDDSKLLDEVRPSAYPAAERAGYIWAYIGEVDKFPAPPVDDCLPEEFVNPEGYVSFRLTVHEWKANWLQAMDGNDGYHAVVLHSASQGVAKEKWTGGQLKQAAVPLEDRRMKIVETPKGLRSVALDAEGKQIHHGHLFNDWHGDPYTLPCLYTIPTSPGPDTGPISIRFYVTPVDEATCRAFRTITMRAETEEQRARCLRLWDEYFHTRYVTVAAEDQAIVESLGDLAKSRSSEFLFNVDRDVLKARRMLADAFLAQREGHRPLPTRHALAYPIANPEEVQFTAAV
jgi:phenylpropionate dioxygenase-like ring-hydroxylating dioxygenase large terminal subunit